MNVKFKMPKFGRDLTGKGWLNELLMTFLGTTISIVLTFGTAAWLDHRQQIKNRRQTAMMVIANIEDFVQNMRNVDAMLVEWDSTLTRITKLSRDSVLRLNDDEVDAFFAAIASGVLLQRDRTAENIFTNDISTWRDVGNLRFIRNVGECYSFINDIEKNYKIQLDRKNKFAQRYMEDYYNNSEMTGGECVATELDMKDTKYFIADFTCSFVHYFEGCIDDLLQYNRENMQLIGVTREEVMEFIKAGEQRTE